MLALLLAFYASTVAASPTSSKLSTLHRRMEVNPPPEMQKQNYMAGKIPVMYNATDADEQKYAWIAKVDLSGGKYGLMLDNMISATWLYSPADMFKCKMEMEHSNSPDGYCYMLKADDKPMADMNQFMIEYTGPGGNGVSGTRSLVKTISCPEGGGAKFPAAIGLVDNTYDMHGVGSSPKVRMYHGVLGLSKMDKHIFEYGEKKTHIYQTPFQQGSGWDYFTTYFNHMDDDDKMYIGLQYTDPAVNMTEMKFLPSGGDSWSVTAGADWKVKVWDQASIGDEAGEPERRFNHKFPMANMSATDNVHFDLGSGTTYLDLETARGIYKAFDGSCTYMPDMGKGMKQMMMKGPMGYPGPMYGRSPVCTFPVKVYVNRTSGESWSEPTKPAKFSLPFGDTDIMIDPMTMTDLVMGPPCVPPGRGGKYGRHKGDGMGGMNPDGMDMDAPQMMKRGGKDAMDTSTTVMPEIETCEMNAYGRIQPNVWDEKADKSKMYWKYGDIVFMNAFVKWTTGTAPTIGVAEYAPMAGTMTPSPSSKKQRMRRKAGRKVRYMKDSF
ncbi:hypothetical protein TWF281_009683 [Arthrobotrys megalospora]